MEGAVAYPYQNTSWSGRPHSSGGGAVAVDLVQCSSLSCTTEAMSYTAAKGRKYGTAVE